MTESTINSNGLTISITIKSDQLHAGQPPANGVDQPEPAAESVREELDYEALVTRLISDARFVDELGKRLGVETLASHVLALKSRIDNPPAEEAAESRPQESARPRVNGYVIPCEGTSVRLFSAVDIYGNVWGMETRNYSPLLRASIDPEEALYLTERELMNGNYRMFGPKALADLMAHKRPLNYRGLHIPSDQQYESAVQFLQQFRDADETGMFAYHLAGNQTVISTARSFRAIAEIMMRHGIACREFPVDVNYPHNASEQS